LGNHQTALTKRSIDTRSGRISYTEAGSGPMALFVHGVVLNKQGGSVVINHAYPVFSHET